MSDRPSLNPDDVAAAMTAFAVGLVAALKEPTNSTGNAVLDQLAVELGHFAQSMAGTAASDVLDRCIAMLQASEPPRE